MPRSLPTLVWPIELALSLVLFACSSRLSSPQQLPHPTAPTTPLPAATAMSTAPPTTPTSPPTLSPDEAFARIRGLLLTNGSCQLPCLWGLRPGTPSISLDPFLAQFGDMVLPPDRLLQVDRFDQMGGIYVFFREGDTDIDSDFSYYESQATLDEMTLWASASHEVGTRQNARTVDLFGDARFLELLQYYMLPSILTNYGQPSEVLVAAFPTAPDEAPRDWEPFSTVLFYREAGFLLEYISPLAVSGTQFVGCPMRSYLNLGVWDPTRSRSLAEAVKKKSGDGIHSLNYEHFRSIESATGLSTDGFITQFIGGDTGACLRTPKSLWVLP